MRDRFANAFVFSALSFAIIGPRASSQDRDVFAIRTALVSVKDETGAPLPGLAAEDFKVEERNVLRDVTEAIWEDKGREIILLVDTSLAFQNEVLPLRKSLQAFLDAVTPDDQITLFEYGQRPRLLVGPTGDRLALQGAVGKVRAWPNEAAYLLDAIAETAREIRSEELPEDRQPVIVVVGGTGPDLSHTSYLQAQELGRKSGAAYHAVIFQAGFGSSLARHEVEETLHELTEKRGGTLSRVLTASAIESELARLGTLLLAPGYRVSFLTEASHQTSEKTLSISVQRAGARAELLRLLPGEKKVTPSTP